MRHVSISASDDRMDCISSFDDPLNALPKKCKSCGFPDLDFVPQPYYLVKSRTMTPHELALAAYGNFLIRERVRRVLEQSVPGECNFYPTQFKGTKEAAPWYLAVPKRQVVTAKVDPDIPRCKSCGEPESAHPGTQYSEYLFGKTRRNKPKAPGYRSDSDYEILKSSTWGSSEISWKLWIGRELFLSVRLLHLLKKLKAKGFYEATCGEPMKPNGEETAWIKQQLRFLDAGGVPLHAEGTISEQDSRWFADYLKRHGRERAKANRRDESFDVKAIEKRLKAKLPKSYLDFMSKVGPRSFDDVDELEVFSVGLLKPEEMERETGAEGSDDEESAAVNGWVFAHAIDGDTFCFDVQKGKKEYAVFVFKHEYQCFEPYAENFVACIKRFVGGAKDGG